MKKLLKSGQKKKSGMLKSFSKKAESFLKVQTKGFHKG